MDETDVVIVGAGPTGLMLANCLAKLGVAAVIVDGKSGPTRESRALVLQARTMEIYDQLGVVDQVLAEAEQASSIVPGFEKRKFGKINLEQLATGITPYPHLYVLEQSKNERILVDTLHHAGREVLWNHSVTSITSDSDKVRVVAGDVTIVARYCVGADGSSSEVRRLLGIPFEGATNEHTFYVADATGVKGLVLDAINLRFGETDFLLTFPMDSIDHQRVLGVVRNSDGSEVSEESARATLDRAFAVTYDRSAWFSTYRVHHRVAQRFRTARVFLAGDAAHVHSPVGAQGMNTGLQDAHNLACKIADVIFGRAPDEYLDRYEAERRPAAKRLVSTTDTMFGVITSDKLGPRLVRRFLLPLAAPLAASLVPRIVASSRIFEYISQIRIHYWMTADAKRAARGRRGKVVGRRLPWNGDNFDSLRNMEWQLHIYGPIDPAVVEHFGTELAVPVSVFTDIRNRRLQSGWAYLVRPDGFVAASAAAGAGELRAGLPAGLQRF
ncbi:MAG TPA: FAD-dependent monooxygenase [Pseudolysinimonas sp.]|nr:FAD-dependent monooxygenase [Pseudolysinimonas sp.]